MSVARLAFYGAGEAALDHARSARHLGATIVAGSASSADSVRWQKFQASFPQAQFEPDPSSFASRNDIDAIVVALPWNRQDDVLDWALRCAKPILIEKPIASASALLRDAVDRHRTTAHNKLVGYNRRFYSTVERLRRRLETGGLRAAQIEISEDVRRLRERRGPEMLAAYLVNSSCHILDVAISLLGPLRVVHMTRYSQSFDGDRFDNFNGLLETNSGLPVSLSCNAYDPVRVGLSCKFDDGTLWRLTPPERLTVYQGYDVVERGAGSEVRRYEPRLVEEFAEDATFRPGFLAQMRAFLSLDFGPGCSPAGALDLLNLTEDIGSSARTVSS